MMVGSVEQGEKVSERRYLDLYRRRDLWEEPIRLRPNRRGLVPVSPHVARSEYTKRIMAWLATYHQAHTWQLQEALGLPDHTFSRYMRPLYLGGFVARGRSRLYGVGAVPYVYTIYDSAETRDWAKGLSYEDWLGVTGGSKINYASNYYRHNLLVGDLMLAVAKYLKPAVVVAGEQYSTAKRLVRGCNSPAIGDAVIGVESGARIVVELVSYVGDRVEDKIARWGRILASADYSQVGLSVVLLNAAPPDRARATSKRIRALMVQALTPKRLGEGGAWMSDREVERARAGIVAADWVDWVGETGVPSISFMQMLGDRLADDDRFESTSVLWRDFRPANPEEWAGPRNNLRLLKCLPEALRG